jgi:Domain of unknown function (DUF4253)
VSSQELPENGELQLGGVRLPAGHRVGTVDEPSPVAWVTLDPVPDAGQVWLALSGLAGQTRLQPVLIADSEPESYFYFPGDVAELDGLNAAEILKEMWREKASAKYPGPRYPLPLDFPGLAPGSESTVDSATITRVLDGLGPVRVALAVADRPADILAITGWFGTHFFQDPLPVAAVLRSWEDRFGARLLQIGPDADLRLLVKRPPMTPEAGLAVTAEHYAFCGAWISEEDGQRIDLTTVSEIAPRVVGSPTWGFWWD